MQNFIEQASRRIGSRDAKLYATPSICDSTDYSQFSLGVGLHKMLLLPEFLAEYELIFNTMFYDMCAERVHMDS